MEILLFLWENSEEGGKESHSGMEESLVMGGGRNIKAEGGQAQTDRQHPGKRSREACLMPNSHCQVDA